MLKIDVRFLGWACAFAILTMANPAKATDYSVVLKNGDRISGVGMTNSGSGLILSNSWNSNIVISTDQILSREIVSKVTNSLPATPPVVAAAPVPRVIPKTNTTLTGAAPKPPAVVWHGELQVGTDLTFSEKDRQLYYARGKLSMERKPFKNTLEYSAAYGKTEGLVSDDRMDGSSKTDYDLGKKMFVYDMASAGYDHTRKIGLRYELGPGVGYHFLNRTNLVINGETGFTYQYRSFTDHTPNDERFFYRFAEDVNWHISHRVSMDERFEFFTRAENLAQYRFRFEGNLRYALLQNLSLVLTVIDSFDTQPAANVNRSDLQIRSSISLKF